MQTCEELHMVAEQVFDDCSVMSAYMSFLLLITTLLTCTNICDAMQTFPTLATNHTHTNTAQADCNKTWTCGTPCRLQMKYAYVPGCCCVSKCSFHSCANNAEVLQFWGKIVLLCLRNLTCMLRKCVY